MQSFLYTFYVHVCVTQKKSLCEKRTNPHLWRNIQFEIPLYNGSSWENFKRKKINFDFQREIDWISRQFFFKSSLGLVLASHLITFNLRRKKWKWNFLKTFFQRDNQVWEPDFGHFYPLINDLCGFSRQKKALDFEIYDRGNRHQTYLIKWFQIKAVASKTGDFPM